MERDAQLLLQHINHAEAAPYHADLTSSETDLANPTRESAAPSGTIRPPAASSGTSAFGESDAGDAGDGSEQVSETFEVVNMPPSRYLCSIPVLAPPPAPNQTATDLAKLEEAKELSRASVRGVELVNGLAGECMYYISGWWSYRFCYGNEVVQFHALSTKTGKPVKDPHSQEYVLGRMLDSANKNQQQKIKQKNDLDVQKPLGGNAADNDPYGTELQVKGDQRYMVQHLGAGTICDLTNRERTIEVQYHCNPGGTSDRISWIKEVTTCSYLMEVRTPRLCEEIAFRPPKPTRAHPINCRLIVGAEEEAPKRDKKMIEAAEAASLLTKEEVMSRLQGQHNLVDQYGEASPVLVVGGIAVGARQALGRGNDGHAPVKLEPPQSFALESGLNEGHAIQVIAKATKAEEGSKIEMLSEEELAELGLSSEAVENLIQTMNTIAGGKAWRLEAFEIPDQDELDVRATIEPDEDEERDSEGHKDQIDESMHSGSRGGNEELGKHESSQAGISGSKDKAGNGRAGDDDGEGSKETMRKDEL